MRNPSALLPRTRRLRSAPVLRSNQAFFLRLELNERIFTVPPMDGRTIPKRGLESAALSKGWRGLEPAKTRFVFGASCGLKSALQRYGQDTPEVVLHVHTGAGFQCPRMGASRFSGKMPARAGANS
jgi:hypothetical protein